MQVTNNINLETRTAMAKLARAYINLPSGTEIPREVNDATLDLLASISSGMAPQPSPNAPLDVRAAFWLPEREAAEVAALVARVRET